MYPAMTPDGKSMTQQKGGMLVGKNESTLFDFSLLLDNTLSHSRSFSKSTVLGF